MQCRHDAFGVRHAGEHRRENGLSLFLTVAHKKRGVAADFAPGVCRVKSAVYKVLPYGISGRHGTRLRPEFQMKGDR